LYFGYRYRTPKTLTRHPRVAVVDGFETVQEKRWTPWIRHCVGTHPFSNASESVKILRRCVERFKITLSRCQSSRQSDVLVHVTLISNCVRQAMSRLRRRQRTYNSSLRTSTNARTPRRSTHTSRAPRTPTTSSSCSTPSLTSSSRTTSRTADFSDTSCLRLFDVLPFARPLPRNVSRSARQWQSSVVLLVAQKSFFSVYFKPKITYSTLRTAQLYLAAIGLDRFSAFNNELRTGPD